MTVVFPWLVPTDPASVASFQAHATVMSHVSPTWYAMAADLSISGQSDPSVIEAAAALGVELHPLIKNARFDPAVAAAILADDATRAQAAETVANLVLDEDFAGINLDFEGPFGAQRDEYADFVGRLAQRLQPAGKRLSVDVVVQLRPPEQESPGSWAAAYDYAALGQACDLVMLMAYDFSHGAAGPNSPLFWVQQAIAYATTLIPAGKLVVGQPFYGRHWIVGGGQVTNTGLSQAEAEQLLAAHGGVPQYTPGDETPWFTWTEDGVVHTVSYEDGTSLATKLEAIIQSGVAGVAFWRLGQEVASQWDVIARGLGAAGRP